MAFPYYTGEHTKLIGAPSYNS